MKLFGLKKMIILYIYDIDAKNKKKFNRTKRRFYYHLNKLNLKKDVWKTKSAIAVTLDMGKVMDLFFKQFKKHIVVYKILTESISQL